MVPRCCQNRLSISQSASPFAVRAAAVSTLACLHFALWSRVGRPAHRRRRAATGTIARAGRFVSALFVHLANLTVSSLYDFSHVADQQHERRLESQLTQLLSPQKRSPSPDSPVHPAVQAHENAVRREEERKSVLCCFSWQLISCCRTRAWMLQENKRREERARELAAQRAEALQLEESLRAKLAEADAALRREQQNAAKALHLTAEDNAALAASAGIVISPERSPPRRNGHGHSHSHSHSRRSNRRSRSRSRSPRSRHNGNDDDATEHSDSGSPQRSTRDRSSRLRKDSGPSSGKRSSKSRRSRRSSRSRSPHRSPPAATATASDSPPKTRARSSKSTSPSFDGAAQAIRAHVRSALEATLTQRVSLLASAFARADCAFCV